ncbi:MAG TPA: OmpA family protein [Anaeromyxobacter sp.]|nr:OmpA family protein [Anaeromyxobacter sp.]
MRRALAFAVLALSLTGCVSLERFKKKEAEANQLRQEYEDEVAKRAVLQEKIVSMQHQLDTLVADVNSLREKIRSDEGNLSVKEGELRASRDRLLELQALVDELSKSKRKLEAAKAELEKKSGEYEQLASSLRGEIEAGRIELMELRGRTTVKMKDKILFASGSATIGPDGKAALRLVADAIRGLQGKVIRVEGHTDNVPTGSGGAFASNWELSAARALAVVHFFQDVGVDPTRISGAGFAEFQPIAPNDTPDGRSLNRRIEIVLVPIEGAVPAPRAQPAAAVQPARM